MKRCLEKIIIPLVCRKRKELGLQDNYPALAIYDGFRGQTTDAIFTLLFVQYKFLPIVLTSCSHWILPLTSP